MLITRKSRKAVIENMFYEIKPYLGLGDLQFGMTRQETRESIGGKVIQIKKTPFCMSETDVFEDQGLHIYYNELKLCEAIECSKPAKVIFQGEEMIGKPYKVIENMVAKIDEDLETDETGFTSYKLGIGVYVPTLKKSKNELIQGVIIFEKGYYD